MSNITIKLKDGTTREFPHQPRAGGSWTNSLKHEGAFVVVIDEWEKRTYIPAADIAEIIETPDRGAW